MGNCLRGSADQSNTQNRGRTRQSSRRVTVGKNQPLKKDRIKWKSEVPLTIGQVRSKREEFWDTAPAFEGRQEIWDALRAAAEAMEKNEHEMAQAIVDGANIIVPTGSLCDCYDELGNRYQLPLYVLSYPTNVLEEGSDSGTGNGEKSPELCGSGEKGDSGAGGGGSSSSGKKSKKGRGGGSSKEEPAGSQLSLRCRLSTGQEHRLSVRSVDPVLVAKAKLAGECGFPVARQRWYCYGQVLLDKMRLDDCRIPQGFVIQVVVHTPDDEAEPVPPNQVTTTAAVEA